MSAPTDIPIVRLNAALDEVGDALASADLVRLLAAEPGLGAALDALIGTTDPDRQAVERARSALLRCRRLGAGLVAFTRLSLDPAGTQAYSRRGGEELPAAPARGGSMEARV